MHVRQRTELIGRRNILKDFNGQNPHCPLVIHLPGIDLDGARLSSMKTMMSLGARAGDTGRSGKSFELTRGNATGSGWPNTVLPRVHPLLVSEWYIANEAALSQVARRLAESQGK